MPSLEESCPGALPPGDLERSLDLLARAQRGDRPALEQLCARYQDRLLRIVRIRLGARGTGLRRFLESTDVVQETWRGALRGLADLRVTGDADLLSWLAKIATNEIRDQLDRVHAQRRDPEREQPITDAGPIDVADRTAGPASEAQRTELTALVDGAIAELDDDYREAIVLRDYCGAEWPDIAARLASPTVHAAQQLHQRAWIKVRRRLAPLLRDE
jgi:RNA polymerase sigma-70 factor (ECF subfamily)